jgi:hypothetical protein
MCPDCQDRAGQARCLVVAIALVIGTSPFIDNFGHIGGVKLIPGGTERRRHWRMNRREEKEEEEEGRGRRKVNACLPSPVGLD